MNRIAPPRIALGVIALTGFGGAANAQDVYFPTDTTINYLVSSNAYVGFANMTDRFANANRTSPTIGLVSGGGIQDVLNSFNSSVININGGSVGFVLQCYNYSTVNLTSGGVSADLDSFDNSRVNISGGKVGFDSLGGGLDAYDQSVVNITGGGIGYDLAGHNHSVINVSGGSVGFNSLREGLFAYDSSTLNFFGSGLSDTLVRFDGVYNHYLLAGRLTDGTSLAGQTLVVQAGSATFHLNNAAVPEPGGVALLVGIASAGVSVFRKRRKHQASQLS